MLEEPVGADDAAEPAARVDPSRNRGDGAGPEKQAGLGERGADAAQECDSGEGRGGAERGAGG